MTDTNRATPPSAGPPAEGIIPRPQFQLRSLPVRHRWEVTRRHPYYQLWWKSAQSQHRNLPTEQPAEIGLRQAAVVILGMIAVSGDPPDPVTEFEQLEADQLHRAWLSGAVHPITFRGMAAILLAALPKETLGQLGTCLVEASRDEEEGGTPHRMLAMVALTSLDKPGLDQFPSEPFVSINPAASGRQINESVNALLKDWKGERDLGEQRNRSEKYEEYLRVWDLREGWADGLYAPNSEHTFKELSAELRMSIATINHHYRNAFEIIFGYPYSPELWARTMGIIKLSSLVVEVPGQVSLRRPLFSPTRREIPASVVWGGSDGNGQRALGALRIVSGLTPDIAGLVGRIQSLISEGLTDEDIVKQLELSPAAVAAVAYLREHADDFSC